MKELIFSTRTESKDFNGREILVYDSSNDVFSDQRIAELITASFRKPFVSKERRRFKSEISSERVANIKNL
jgi:hypothetical protein